MVRSVPGHYIWFLLEGTPPINSRLVNTSTSLKGDYIIKWIQLHRTGNYTLLAENEEGTDSKTVEVTFLGKDSMLLNFIQSRWDILLYINNPGSSHKQLSWLLSLFYPLMIQFIRWKMNVKRFRRFAFAWFTIVLSTDNLCQLKFINNKDLANTGNLYFTLRPIARISQTFNLQEDFFLIEYFILQFFIMTMRECRWFKRKKSRRKVLL